MTIHSNSRSQVAPYLMPSVNTDQLVGNSTDIQNMGNDAISYNPGGGSVLVRAIVCDGAVPSLFIASSSAGGGFSTAFSFVYPDVIDPDVALIYKNGFTYALVSYARASGGMYLEVFSISGASATYLSNHLVSTSSATLLQNTINIDSDQNDRFAIVWDEQGGNGQIQAMAGYVNGAGAIVLGTTCSLPIPLACSGSGLPTALPLIQPDVAVFSAGGPGGLTNCIINVSCIDGYGDLHVIIDRFLDIFNGTPANIASSSFCVTPLPGTTFNLPRIACQRYNASVSWAQTGIAVIYEVINAANNTYDIGSTTTFFDLLANPQQSFQNTFILTDGTCPSYNGAPPINISTPNAENHRPVVTYNRNSGSFNQVDPILLIGWEHFTGGPYLPVVGYQIGSGEYFYFLPLAGIVNYQEVPLNPSGDETILSISGEQSNQMLYSWRDKNHDIYTKTVKYGNQLKVADEPASNWVWLQGDQIIISEGQESATEIHLEIFDVQGKLLTSFSSEPGSTIDLRKFSYSKGMYFVQVRKNGSSKLFKYSRP